MRVLGRLTDTASVSRAVAGRIKSLQRRWPRPTTRGAEVQTWWNLRENRLGVSGWHHDLGSSRRRRPGRQAAATPCRRCQHVSSTPEDSRELGGTAVNGSAPAID